MRHVYCIVGEGFIQNADVLVSFALSTPRMQGSPVALVGSPAEQPPLYCHFALLWSFTVE